VRGDPLHRDPLAEVVWDAARDAVGMEVAVIVEETPYCGSGLYEAGGVDSSGPTHRKTAARRNCTGPKRPAGRAPPRALRWAGNLPHPRRRLDAQQSRGVADEPAWTTSLPNPRTVPYEPYCHWRMHTAARSRPDFAMTVKCSCTS
jgi:hypothetical protein